MDVGQNLAPHMDYFYLVNNLGGLDTLVVIILIMSNASFYSTLEAIIKKWREVNPMLKLLFLHAMGRCRSWRRGLFSLRGGLTSSNNNTFSEPMHGQ